MAKGPLITAQVEALIASVYEQHPKWKAPMVRNEVEFILRKKNRNSPKGWPSLSIVQKTLATVRRNLANPSPEDEPWSLSTLKDYPIPPEALPKVLEDYKQHKLLDEKDNGTFEIPEEVQRKFASRRLNPEKLPKTNFSVRDAKWVAQLSATQCRVSAVLPYLISESERLYELIGRSPAWEIYDKLLSGLELEAAEIAETTMVLMFRRMPFLLGMTDEDMGQLQEAITQYNIGLDKLRKEAKEKAPDRQKEEKNERKQERSKDEGRHKETK